MSVLTEPLPHLSSNIVVQYIGLLPYRLKVITLANVKTSSTTFRFIWTCFFNVPKKCGQLYGA